MKASNMSAKPLWAATLCIACCTASAAAWRTTQYWLDHPAERATKLKECQVNAAKMKNTPDCVNAGKAATKALGGGKPVHAGDPAVPAANPVQPSDEACTTEALKAIPNNKAREDRAAACIRRGTFKPTPHTRAY